MNPFFKSSSGTVVPFSVVTAIYAIDFNYRAYINITTGIVPNFTFKSREDYLTQLASYEAYLINQYKLKELL